MTEIFSSPARNYHHTVDVNVHLAGLDDTARIFRKLAKLLTIGECTMSAISDFAAAQAVHNDRMSGAIVGLAGDIAELNRMIAELQASSGVVSPEDQAMLDALQAKAGEIADQLDAVDQMTPPVAPLEA